MKKTETGWRSSFGVDLTHPCEKCKVWIGPDEKGRMVEFDGMPHKRDCTKGFSEKNLESLKSDQPQTTL